MEGERVIEDSMKIDDQDPLGWLSGESGFGMAGNGEDDSFMAFLLRSGEIKTTRSACI